MRRSLFKHKAQPGGSTPYVSPYLLEILSTQPHAPVWHSATGTLTANTGQVVSCSRASSAYCLGDDGLLHLLGANTVRVEPTGLLVEQHSTNYCLSSNAIGDANWNPYGGFAPTITLDTTDVTDIFGGNHATKLVYPPTSPGDTGWLYQLTGSGSGSSMSMYLRMPNGQSGTIYFARVDGSPDYVALSVTDQWQLFQAPSTGYIVLGYGNDAGTAPGGAGGTFYAIAAQVEPFPFATSRITTTGASATRDGDYVTVTNPLAALSQPVPTWRVGTWAKPLPGGTWSTVGTAALDIFLASGPNGAADSFRLGNGAGYHTNGGGDVNTNGFSCGNPPVWADQSTDDALSVTLFCSGTDVTAVPALASEPVTVGTMTQDSSITLGDPVGFTQYGHQGHMRDIFVDNT